MRARPASERRAGYEAAASRTWQTIERVGPIDRREFYGEFVVPRRPVVITGLMDQWTALSWNREYFRARDRGVKLAVKMGDVSAGNRESVSLGGYVALLEEYEARLASGAGGARPPYLHDVPFFHLYPELRPDIEPFPLHLFPEWYWPNWQDFIQFFMGSTGSLTPLHFDTLLTNNLFFQVVGRKKFILIPAEQKASCYVEGWRWAKFDPSKPDYATYPQSAQTTPVEVVLAPGDLLYIPPGTLHQVHGLSFSISFNIDWHTTRSAGAGLMTIFKGAPMKNGYYNLLSFIGLGLKVPSRYVFPYYRSYLNYVS